MTAATVARATDFSAQVELGKSHARIGLVLQSHFVQRLNFEI
jgi:hypothetical protein